MGRDLTPPSDRRDASALAGTAPAFRRVEMIAIGALPLLAVALGSRVRGSLSSPTFVVLAIAAGFVGADFLSGMIHWFFDTWLSPETPLLGRAFVRTFREHHVDPTAICGHDFVETNGSNAIAGGILVLMGHAAESAGEDFAAAALLFIGIFSSVTSQIHKWAHAERVPRPVAWLQRARLVLSPEAHRAHHAAPYDRAYCITSGWLNRLLHGARFFRAIERVVRMTTGAVPRGDEATWAEALQRSTSASQPVPSAMVTSVVGTPTRK